MKNKAFTLIELLVVIAVLGLLSSIVLVSLRGQDRRAEYANLLLYDAQIKHALGAYILGEWTFDNDTLADTSGNNRDGEWDTLGGIGGYTDNDVKELNRALDLRGTGGGLSVNVLDLNLDRLEGLTVSS